MTMSILNADCKFCGAKARFECTTREDITRISREWLKQHGPCAKGRGARIDWTGQKDERDPEQPILTALVRGSN